MVAIVDYKAGNLFSVKNAFDKLGIDSVITSEVDVIKNADKILVLEDGNIVEQGTHEELLKKNDSIMYTVVVKNIGKTSGEFNIIDEIPEGIKVEKIDYTKDNNETFSFETSKQKLEITNFLEKGKTFTYRIYGSIDNISTLNGEIRTLTNFATLVTENYQQKSNNVMLKIKTEHQAENPDLPNNSENPNNPGNSECP